MHGEATVQLVWAAHVDIRHRKGIKRKALSIRIAQFRQLMRPIGK